MPEESGVKAVRGARRTSRGQPSQGTGRCLVGCRPAAGGARRPATRLVRWPRGATSGRAWWCRRAASTAHPVQVDHDHETGKVRGVLCFSCSAALGQFKDRPDVLRRAAEYLEGNVWKPIPESPGVCQLPS
ncbi:endonuclease domain-containing protein [Streptomyces sp. Edi2]|uniref:endonuclease domain-containing protein n=1 Tax=Streptomyces sp. Edi2 TaxID=3162528 RepID=UPI0033063DC9